MDMTDPLLEVEDLEVAYQTPEGRLTAVSDATFTIEREQFFGLVGESGCGKSTLIKSIINGLDPNGAITSGTIKYKGEEIQGYSDQQFNEKIRWDEISYIPQGSMNSLDPIERINKQAVRIGQAHTDLGKEALLERLRELFDVVGIPRERISDYPHQFSGGMKQRAIIALSLLLDPELIIADEPTTALDVTIETKILNLIEDLADDMGTAVQLITHDLGVIAEFCDRVMVMYAGKPVEKAPVEDLYYDPKHPYTVGLMSSIPRIGDKRDRLQTIPGTMPDLIELPPGCSFHTRCPFAEEVCARKEPPLLDPETGDPTTVDSERGAACLEYSGDLSKGLDYEIVVRDETSDPTAAATGGDSDE